MSQNLQLLRDSLTVLLRFWGTFTSGPKIFEKSGGPFCKFLDSFGCHWKPTAVKIHIFVRQGKPRLYRKFPNLFLQTLTAGDNFQKWR